jgi:hypothetical protein
LDGGVSEIIGFYGFWFVAGTGAVAGSFSKMHEASGGMHEELGFAFGLIMMRRRSMLDLRVRSC